MSGNPELGIAGSVMGNNHYAAVPGTFAMPCCTNIADTAASC